MLTSSEPIQLAEALEKSGLIRDLQRALGTRPSLSVNHAQSPQQSPQSLPVSPRPSNSLPSPSPLSTSDAPGRRRGGWRSTRCISKELRELAVHGAIELARQGYPLNVMVTYRPPDDLSDAEGKRWIALRHARIGQALERNGHAFIGLKAFEKRPGARLHAHALYHVTRSCMGVIENAVDLFERNPKRGQKGDVPIHGRHATPEDVGYVLKQRRWAGPNIERSRLRWLPYQQGDTIVGTRVSFTKAAKVAISRAEAKPKALAKPLAQVPPPPASPRSMLTLVVNALVAEPLQLGLFPERERPVSRLAQFAQGVMPAAVAREVEARRGWLGLTQAELAAQIGISRPQLVNALQGRFGLSEWAVARLREFMLRPAPPSLPRAA